MGRYSRSNDGHEGTKDTKKSHALEGMLVPLLIFFVIFVPSWRSFPY